MVLVDTVGFLEGEEVKRIDRLRQQAVAGDADAQAELGWAYDQGRGVRKSYSKAFEWYLKAARQGHPIAQYNLNLCYLLGQGVPRNNKKAFYWAKKSAEAGDPDAILALGWHYHGGCGVRVDIRRAEYWYRKSASKGEPKAFFSLGQLLYDKGSYAHAKKWFLKGASQNHPRSNYYLGRMYLDGLGVRKDATKAQTYLKAAARLRVPSAKRLLHSKKLRKQLALSRTTSDMKGKR